MKNQLIILVLYVNFLFLNREEHQIVWWMRELTFEFEDLILMHYFLEVWKRKYDIFSFATKAHN